MSVPKVDKPKRNGGDPFSQLEVLVERHYEMAEELKELLNRLRGHQDNDL